MPIHHLPQALMPQALQHFQRGELEKAGALLRRVLDTQPRDFDALHMMGVIEAMEGKPQKAVELLTKALSVKKNNPFVHFNLARALIELDKHEDALAHHRKATELAPGHAVAWLNFGKSLFELERISESISAFDKALQIQPDYAEALNNKGLALTELGRITESIACFQQAIAHQPDLTDAHWNLALEQLKLGKFDAAWNDFDFRWGTEGYTKPVWAEQKPDWSGKASAAPLLLWGEQGIGDQILYASILPELAELPQKKYVALDKRLIPLFERSMPGFEFVDLATVSDALGFAEQLPLGSLPRFFRQDLASFSNARHPYLQADAGRSAELRHKIACGERLVCGVSWASKRQKLGPYKSLSLEQMLLPLASSRLHFVDLQYGDTAAERQALQQAHGIEVQHLDDVDNFHDIDGLAALIQACDVVITTSNSTAHLAGALGKSTLLLLPSGKGQFWYWAEISGAIPWYPSIETFRQKETGNWQHPLQAIKAAPETR
jgi:tetratricopeptide (TPR) repeat protein